MRRSRFLLFFAFPTLAAAISLDPNQFTSPLQLLSDQAASSAAQAIGLGGEFKPLTGVNPPSSLLGLELSVSAQASKIPDEFRQTLKDAGFDSAIPGVIPAARLQANLRLGSRAAFEGAWLSYRGYKLLGAALKIKIVNPEEGFGAAIRIAYSDNDLGIVSTRTWTPALILGNKLDFAEPYVGVSYSMAKARVELPLSIAGFSQIFTADGKKNGLALFGGLVFDLALFQIAFEGNYSNAGVPGLAMRVGMRF